MTVAEAAGNHARRVVVVGGSLVGLSAAIALAHRGARVTVLDRSHGSGYEIGGGLGVDVDLLTQVTGAAGSPPVCHGADRDTTAWPLLVGWLEAEARAVPGIEIRRDTEVVKVGDGSVQTADGHCVDADLVIGSDGAHSTVRRWVSPGRSDAVYSGFLLWRAMVAEAELPPSISWLRSDEPSREYYSGPYRLVTYLVPGIDGSSQPGNRRLNLVWYDPARSELLASRGLLDGVTVRGTLAARDVPGPLRRELEMVAGQRWPSPWREALEIAFQRSLVFATAVVEYWPDRLIRGRVALAGDAAHAASPMVGGGFRQGLYDVAALAAGFRRDRRVPVTDVLAHYEQERVASAQAHVARSQAASARFLQRKNLH
jgi:2-polyprenyl-6-methoxyphenol hydroxylase-like FAD-dependent oxidoreductase